MTETTDTELLHRLELAQELGFTHPADAVTIVRGEDLPDTALRELAKSGRLAMDQATQKKKPGTLTKPRFYI